MTLQTSSSPLVPRSSHGRGRPQVGVLVWSSTTYVDEHTNRSPKTTTHKPLLVPSPRDEHNPPENRMSRHLVTPRTIPAWTAIHDLLTDGQWHTTGDVAQVMRDTADLADRTIENHLRSASARRWITQRRGRIRMREDFAHHLEVVGS